MITVDDVSREEWIELAESAIDMLACARFMFWIAGGDSDSDDKSCRNSMNRLAAALNAIGLNQGTIEEFEFNIEALLKSGKSPSEFALALQPLKDKTC